MSTSIIRTRAQKRAAEQQRQREQEQQSSKRAKQKANNKESNATSSSSPPLSLAQRCFTDGLLSIFSFLTLRELLPTAHSCKDWYAAAQKEKSRGVSCSLPPSRWPGLSASPLRHHIARIRPYDLLNGDMVGVPQLSPLSSLPRLTDLQFSLLRFPCSRPAQREQARQQLAAGLPDTLRDLCIEVPGAGETGGMQQTVVFALAGLPQLTELTLRLPEQEYSGPTIDLQPLLQLEQLARLTLRGISLLPLCTVFRQMRSLRSLHLNLGNKWTVAELVALCGQPNQLQQLQEINLGCTILTDEHMQQLQKLPGLTALEPRSFDLSALPFLSSFPSLQRLFICGGFGPDWSSPAASSALISALSSCPALTDVTFYHLRLSQTAASSLLQSLPQLRTLLVSDCEWLSDLSFLRTAPQLEELELVDGSPDPKDAAALLSLSRLRRLRLHRSVRLDDGTLAALQPPSTLLPSLTHFQYYEPQVEAE